MKAVTFESTVFVVDDDEAVGRSLRYLIESIGLKVEVFQSASVFVEKYNPARLGCLVLDVRMPGMSGLDLQEWLCQHDVDIPVIFVTGHADVLMAVRAMKTGAIDFIEKPFRDQDLLDQIHRALGQDAEKRRVRARYATVIRRFESLTDRERRVMKLVVAGHPNKVIAAQLELSSKTVEAYRAKVMEKMEAKSLPELVKMALEARIATYQT